MKQSYTGLSGAIYTIVCIVCTICRSGPISSKSPDYAATQHALLPKIFHSLREHFVVRVLFIVVCLSPVGVVQRIIEFGSR
jgi:hypothetical protein